MHFRVITKNYEANLEKKFPRKFILKSFGLKTRFRPIDLCRYLPIIVNACSTLCFFLILQKFPAERVPIAL